MVPLVTPIDTARHGSAAGCASGTTRVRRHHVRRARLDLRLNERLKGGLLG